MPGERRRVVVVEADPALADRYASWVPAEWTVDRAGDGEAALAAAGGTDAVVVGNVPGDRPAALVRRLHNRGYEGQVVWIAEGDPSPDTDSDSRSDHGSDSGPDPGHDSDSDPDHGSVSGSDLDVVASVVDEVLVAPVEERVFRDCIERVDERMTYDECLREYFALVSRRALLEARRSPEELAASDEYARLEERIRRTGRRLDDLLAGFSEDGYVRLFEGFFPGTAAP